MGLSEQSGDAVSSGGGESQELPAGHVLAGRYRIEGKIGTGGIGIVYRAVQLPLERPVAVKVLHEDLAALDELRARFEREARVLSALTHPHVVSISDYGIDEDRPFLVMELLEGQTLEDVLRESPLDPERALAIARQILRGLAFAHSKGIAHRDLKPANVFLQRMPDGSEHVKLLDFGLARMVQSDGQADDQPTLTKRGVVFGTPAYMSPEQASGGEADERSDVYSAGVLLFELLAGRRPFLGETRAELLRAHLTSPVPRLASVRPELRVKPELADLIDTAMAKEESERYADARDMLAALDAIEAPLAWLVPPDQVSEAPTQMAGSPVARPERRRSWLAPLSIALALVAGVAVWQAWPALEERAALALPELGSVAPDAEEEAQGRPAARDPWAIPPPEPLRPFLRMVDEGQVFQDRAEIRPLYALASEMEGDPRPRLLLGHLFFARGWLTEGIRRYEMAAAMDPSVRGDRRMLANLVEAASRESVGERAAAAIEQIYGVEAVPALQAAIDEHEGRPLAQLRLVELRDRLIAGAQ
ncbi:MAG TPA: serine/threonine-protein kinase [Sandaracinaceae bacterium]